MAVRADVAPAIVVVVVQGEQVFEGKTSWIYPVGITKVSLRFYGLSVRVCDESLPALLHRRALQARGRRAYDELPAGESEMAYDE